MAAQGGDGDTIPGGAQETHRFCVEEHSLVGNICDRWTLELDDLWMSFPTSAIP